MPAKPASTIVAHSSGPLPSGVAVIRLSGPAALDAASALAGALPPPRTLALRRLVDPASGQTLDSGLVAVFPAPHSFTGEDCAELHLHGSPAGVRATLRALLAWPGVVLAGPGDFTRRAFENGKLDLTAVEGLGDLIAAETESQRRQALSRYSGALGARIGAWRDLLLDARAEIEAHLDFADEDDVPAMLPERFVVGLDALATDLRDALAGYRAGRIVREGFRIVLAGPPNAGKSSLLNALAGSDIAIVTQEAGTTRDVRDVQIDIDGQLVIVTDTAGLRDTGSLAEAEGIARAHRAMAAADLVLWMIRADGPDVPAPIVATALRRVASQADRGTPRFAHDVAVSVHALGGLDGLRLEIATHLEHYRVGEPPLVSHERDRLALEAALGDVEAARALLAQPELCAERLRHASDALAGLIGLLDTESVLDRLFAGFCIGK